jgi:hypothetical protein
MFQKTFEWIRKCVPGILVFLFGISIIFYAIYSSVGECSTTIKKASDLYSLLTPSLIFIGVTTLKLLAGFWIFAIAISIFYWEHISEQGAKIFGIEIQQKFNRQELDNARSGIEIVRTQIKLLSNLHDYIYKFSISSFKRLILESEAIPDKVRNEVNNILVLAYQNNFPKVEIKVLPIDEQTINSLEPRIKAPVETLLNRDEPDSIDIEYENLGIGIHRGYEGLETIIIIDTSKEGYEISLAEIESAGNLFLSIANTIAV